MKHIKEFDGLRGLLALWVFATHVIELGPYPAAARFVNANLAVDIFIILSGFVIFHLLSTGEDYRTFITRRWFRLFPVFAVCFLIAAALYAGLGLEDETAFTIGQRKKLLPYLVTHATMLHGAVPEQLLPSPAKAILPPAWSISVEWQFYLFAPLFFALATRPHLKVAFVGAALIAARVLCEIGRHTGQLTFEMQAFLPLKLEFFAVGIGSYGVWQWLSERNRPLSVPRLCYALLVPMLILVAKKSPAIAMWICGLLALTNAHFGSNAWSARALSRLLNSRPAQFLGRLSYCVYLLHLPALVLIRHVIVFNQPHLRAPMLQLALIVGGLAATVAGGWLLHTAIEQPMMRFGKRVTEAWKAHAPAPASLKAA
jgi:peptidoglycan/LPS O-acetylase OafA/YrhL